MASEWWRSPMWHRAVRLVSGRAGKQTWRMAQPLGCRACTLPQCAFTRILVRNSRLASNRDALRVKLPIMLKHTFRTVISQRKKQSTNVERVRSDVRWQHRTCEGWQAEAPALCSPTAEPQYICPAETETCVGPKSSGEKTRGEGRIPCGASKWRSNVGREKIQERGLRRRSRSWRTETQNSSSVNLEVKWDQNTKDSREKQLKNSRPKQRHFPQRQECTDDRVTENSTQLGSQLTTD